MIGVSDNDDSDDSDNNGLNSSMVSNIARLVEGKFINIVVNGKGEGFTK
jgi:hypothetical protein